MNESDKRLAALAAIAEVRAGMIVGLGTGSTAAFAIAALGEQVRAGLRIQAVATSLATEASAREAGIQLIEMPARIDLTIDGADEIDDALNAIKGAGGAMLREKVVAAAIDAIPGALGHGLFLAEVDAAYIATDGVVTRLERGRASD